MSNFDPGFAPAKTKVVFLETEEEVLPKILEFIGDYPIVAHNAIFDYSFLNEAKKRVLGEELKNPNNPDSDT